MTETKVVSAHTIQKTVQWGPDISGEEVMAISEIKAGKIEHQIIFDEWEQLELYRILEEKYPAQDGGSDEKLNNATEGEEGEEDEPKYLIIETRTNGGKKRAVLNWCENTAEALDTLMTMWKENEMSTVAELEGKVKIVKYSDIVSLGDIWEGPGEGE